MAYVDGYVHDVFVSYAEADDQSMDGREGWVSTFVKRLRVALTQRLGGQVPNVFFGNNQLQANEQLDEILNSVRGSALFLAVGSRAFIERTWTNLELDTFVGTGAAPARIFLIECMPPWPDQKYPAPIEHHRRLKFHSPTGQQGRIDVPLSPVDDSVRFNTLVHDLAHWISQALRMLKTTGTVPTGQVHAPTPVQMPASVPVYTVPASAKAAVPEQPKAGRTVLVAQATDDLEDEAAGLCRYLEQFGIRVLPQEAYPQGGAEFSEAFQHDLAQADLFVQLLGRRPGRAPRDLPEGYTLHQHACACERGLEILQWRDPDVDPRDGTNDHYRQVLDGPAVVASGLEAFKALVKEAALKRPVAGQQRRVAGLAFINAEPGDIEMAKVVQAQFDQADISTVLPLQDQGSAATRADLEENLLESDVLVFIYGKSPPEWIRSQLRLYNKVRPRRTSDPQGLAICLVPPNANAETGMSIPGSHVIDIRAGDVEPVRQFVRAKLK